MKCLKNRNYLLHENVPSLFGDIEISNKDHESVFPLVRPISKREGGWIRGWILCNTVCYTIIDYHVFRNTITVVEFSL